MSQLLHTRVITNVRLRKGHGRNLQQKKAAYGDISNPPNYLNDLNLKDGESEEREERVQNEEGTVDSSQSKGGVIALKE